MQREQRHSEQREQRCLERRSVSSAIQSSSAVQGRAAWSGEQRGRGGKDSSPSNLDILPGCAPQTPHNRLKDAARPNTPPARRGAARRSDAEKTRPGP